MQIIREKSTKKTFYIFPDSENIELSETGMNTNSVITHDIKSSTHEIVSGEYPTKWVGGGLLIFDVTWSIANQSEYDQYMIEEAKWNKPIPHSSVSMRQARLQLLALGKLTTVNTAIISMPESAQIEWEYATEVQRNNPLVNAMIQLLTWTPTDVDNYFIEAYKL